MRSISGTTAMLSLRGKMPVRMIVALGALRRQRSTSARKSSDDVRNLLVAAGLRADVVRAGEDDDHLRVDAVELTVLEAPEHVLNLVGTPAEVRSVPPEEVR